MRSSLIVPSYIEWHYTDALRNIWGIVTNLIWFFYHFFSVPVLLKTLFLPWHATRQKNISGFKNFILRTIGFLIRAVVLIFAFAMIGVLFVSSIAFYVLWILFPCILFVLFTSIVWLFSV